MDTIVLKDESFDIIGAAMRVHGALGCGFSEKVYQDAMEIEFREQGIPYGRECHTRVEYHGITLNTDFIPDFICYDSIIVELKAVKELDDFHRAQALNYARVANLPLAVLINFGGTSLTYERFPNKRYKRPIDIVQDS